MQEIELLAPVGGWEALEAAVQNGADAVYLSGKSFGARQSADNFDREALQRAVQYCHIRDVKVFVTVNTLITNEELQQMGEYLLFLYNIDIDAIIVQDLGVAKLARDLFPDLRLHASTQMSVHNLEGVKLLEDLGFSRVVLAREMTIDEIEYVQKNTKLEIEVFVHGALCVGYSGQCLMSSMIGGRSGNRGRCAQPCRMTYSLVDMDKGVEVRSDVGHYLMSPRDLNTLENINEILNTGIKSVKIEGRMKRAEYVATVVGGYRKAIDQYRVSGERPKLEDGLLSDVTQVFNRGFTKGYILREKGKDIMGFAKPGNRGIKVGEVLSYDKNRERVQIRLQRDLSKGDGIEIWAPKGDNSGTIVENIFIKGQKRDQGHANDVIDINYRHMVSKASPVYKTSDIKLLRKAKETYERNDKQIPLYGQIKGKLGETLALSLWDEKGNRILTNGTYIVEKALKNPMSKERVLEQISKLGNTPYGLVSLDIDIEEGSMVPASELNQLRRNAIEALNELRQNHHHRKPLGVEHFNQQFKEWIAPKDVSQDKKLKIHVGVNNLAQLEAALEFPIDRIYYGDMATFEDAMEMVKGYDVALILAPFRITEDDELKEIKETIVSLKDLDGILVSNLGLLNLMKDTMEVPIITDFSLNVFNNGAVDLLRELKVNEITLSPELTLNQIKDIIKRGGGPCEVMIYGYQPLMVTKYCPLSTVLNSGDSCVQCNHKQFGLRDRMNLVFPLLTSDNCKTEILNAQKLCVIDRLEEFIDADIRNFRLSFTIEDKKEVYNTLKAHVEILENRGNNDGNRSVATEAFIRKIKEGGFTKGHFFRGVQ